MLSRKLYANAMLGRTLDRRYRNQTSRSTSVKLEKQQILDNFDNRDVDDLKKRCKFSPHVETDIEPIPPIIPLCDLVDTGFEDDCDYYGSLYLLGDYIILDNFETRGDEDIGGEIFNVSLFKYVEDFENNEISGVTVML